jgi:hypothetical protein
MSALNITTDTSGKIIEVKVDDKIISNVSDVSQNLIRGELVATIKATFDSITATEQAGTPAPALIITFAAGTVTGSTKVTITGDAGSGNHFAYAIANATQDTPNVGDAITGATTYASGNNITGVTTGKSVAVYELTADNKVVKFTAHTLVDSDINASA